MRTFAIWLVAISTIATASQAPGPRDAAPVPSGTATITGRVVVAGGNDPVPVRRARVVAEINGGQLITDTDINGAFRFANAPAGNYRIRAEKPGFVMPEPVRWEGVVMGTLIVIDGQTASQNFMMLRGAAFEGRIVTDRGEPAVNVVVSAVRLRYGPYGRVPVAVKSTRTDDRGRYRIHTLAAGDYYIEAGPDPLDARVAPTALARLLYPGTPRTAEAQKMTATVGGDVSGLDFKLTQVPTVRVTGTVKDSSGKPVTTMALRIQRVGGPSGEVRAFYLSETGQFFANAVTPGDYWLSASVLNAAKTPEFSLQRVTIGNVPASFDLVTAPGAAVHGRVEVAGNAAPLPANLSVMAFETDLELAVPQPLAATANRAPVGGDGSFVFPYLPNARLVRIANLPDGWAVASVVLEAADISDAPTAFPAGAASGGLRVILTAATGAVSGFVADAKGRFLAGARVIVFAEDEKRWTLYSRFVHTLETSGGGAYRVAGLVPGRYRAVAVEALDDNAWNDPEVLRALWGRATAFDVAAGSTAKLALTLKDRP